MSRTAGIVDIAARISEHTGHWPDSLLIRLKNCAIVQQSSGAEVRQIIEN
jgi:hypothetical protein